MFITDALNKVHSSKLEEQFWRLVAQISQKCGMKFSSAFVLRFLVTCSTVVSTRTPGKENCILVRVWARYFLWGAMCSPTILIWIWESKWWNARYILLERVSRLDLIIIAPLNTEKMCETSILASELWLIY